jgi:16S rRNA A1518/A1519 N6-dimethyltransferase RsmA/KsgA/DIM1 with predicted DNA glycosylase/AP lyase activity
VKKYFPTMVGMKDYKKRINMKSEEVIINDDYIVLKENTRSVVMSKGAKSITEIYSYVVSQNRGDVLDVGFGMGFSANKISKLADSYTCIEINPQIYETAKEWSKDKPNVEIIFGDWIDVIPTLNKNLMVFSLIPIMTPTHI